MNDQDKLYYEKTTGSVNTTLTIIVKLFDILGIQGMKALIDPSFEETKTQIKLMRLAIDDYEVNLQELPSTPNSSSALTMIQNVKEATQVADHLMTAIQEGNQEDCDKYVDRLREINIIIPLWV